MHHLFRGSPKHVAPKLVGKKLKIGEKEGTILAVLPQDAIRNSLWIEKRPLFGTHPVDVYVAMYRGNAMLFLRTGEKNTCVRIDSMQIGDEVCKTPGKVCRVLGISQERTGEVEVDGDRLIVKLTS